MLIISFALVGVMGLTAVAYIITSRPLSELRAQELKQLNPDPPSAEAAASASGEQQHHQSSDHLDLAAQPGANKVAELDATTKDILSDQPSHFKDSFSNETTQMLEDHSSSSEPHVSG